MSKLSRMFDSKAFWRGFFEAFSWCPTLRSPPRHSLSSDDFDSWKRDWEKIGEDLRKAMASLPPPPAPPKR